MNNKQIKTFLEEAGIEIDDQDIQTFSTIYEKLVEAKGKITDGKQKKSFNKILKALSSIEDKDPSLFPNEIPQNHFGIPSIFSDTYSNAIDEVETQKEIIENSLQKYSQYNNGAIQVQIDNKGQLGLKFDDDIVEIKSDDDIENIFDVIKRTIQDGVILQHYCALWNYATKTLNSFRFSYVKIDDVLETFLKKPQDGYFRKTTRENFTKSIRTLQKMKIRIPVKTKDKNSKGGKYVNIPLLNFELSVENKSGSVMLSLVGELLGSNKQNNRGRVFPEGIFQLDSRMEGERISLAFKLATRFDQLNHKPIVWDRKKLIKHAGLEKSNATDKHNASLYLKKTLERLKEIKCILDYQDKEISNDDNQKITLYSSLSEKQQLQ